MSGAERYAQLLATAKIRERPLFSQPRSFSELELQARWFAGDFGRSFTGTAGRRDRDRAIRHLESRGRPDFSDAAIRINGGDISRGSIEFDLTDQSWETHGHATNPAFDGTVLHVFVAAGAPRIFHPHNVESGGPAGAGRSGDVALRFSAQSAAGAAGPLSCAAARSAGGKNLRHPRRGGAISPAAQSAAAATADRTAWRG